MLRPREHRSCLGVVKGGEVTNEKETKVKDDHELEVQGELKV